MAVVGKNFAIMESGRILDERVPGLAGMGLCPYHVPSTASEPAAGPKAVALDVFDRAARCASDFRATTGG